MLMPPAMRRSTPGAADNEPLKAAMAAAADLHARIYERYNLPYDPAPGEGLLRLLRLLRLLPLHPLCRPSLQDWRSGSCVACCSMPAAARPARSSTVPAPPAIAASCTAERAGCAMNPGTQLETINRLMSVKPADMLPRTPAQPLAPAGSLLDKAAKLWRKKQARRQRSLDKKLQREAQRIRRMEAADAAARGEGRRGEPSKEAEREEPPSEDDEGGIDEDDLIASTAGVEAPQQQAGGSPQQQQQPFQPPSVLASASLGLTRAAVALQRAFHAAAVRAPPRRCLTRPQRAAQ